MQIQINFGDVQGSPALTDRVNDVVNDVMRLFSDQITRIEVHLRDENGPKSGNDKRCLIEARLAGHDPIAVESRGADLYNTINDAAGKLQRAVRNKLERHETKMKRNNA